MTFREVSVVQIKEALRRWLKGEGDRTIATGVGVDRKTVRRYATAAMEAGLDRPGGEEQFGDEPIGQVVKQNAFVLRMRALHHNALSPNFTPGKNLLLAAFLDPADSELYPGLGPRGRGGRRRNPADGR